MEKEPLASLVERALRDGPFSMRQLADDASLKYDVLRAWAIGRRNPSSENLIKIAEGFERRAELLTQLGIELRRAARERDQ